MQDLLINLELNKDKWIYRAIERYTSGFLRYDSLEMNRDDLLIGVYGPTQVGKTTFILTLLGIGIDEISSLTTALRGGRNKGRSSTITTFIYKQSPDSNYYLKIPNQIPVKLTLLLELEDQMKNIRRQIESGELFLEKPIILEISQDMFTNQIFAQKSNNLSIIDLPGDDTKDNKERQNVNRILDDYLQLCNVVLIMEIASQMVTLSQLSRPFIKDWMYYPQNFRILLTRSLGDSQTRDAIMSGEVTSLEDFKCYYYKELSRLHEPIENGIYPVEFGDSWVELKNNSPELFLKTEQWMINQFATLIEDITTLHKPENRVLQMKNIDKGIKKQRKNELEDFRLELEQILKQQDKTQKKINYNHFQINRNKESAALLRCSMEFICKLEVMKYNSTREISNEEMKVSYLEQTYSLLMSGMLEHYHGEMKKALDAIKKTMEEHDIDADLWWKEGEIDSSFYPVHKGVFNQYLSKKKFMKDYDRLVDKLEENDRELRNHYKLQIRGLAKKNKSKLHEKERGLTFGALSYEKGISQLTEEFLRLEKQADLQTSRIEKARKEWEFDLKRTEKLDEILKESYIEEAQMLESLLLSDETTSDVKWGIQQYWTIITGTAERLIDFGSQY